MSPSGWLGATLVAIVVVTAAAAPLLATYDPAAIDVAHRFAAPGVAHWLGTDQAGRDIYSRLVFGTRVAMAIALSTIALALTIGGALGIAAAFAKGWTERVILWVFDVNAAFPGLILALAVVAVYGPSGLNLVLVMAASMVPQFGRVARAQALALKSAPFLEVERILGAGPLRIVVHHVLPNIAGPLIMLASMDIPVVIAVEAGLSFIGLSVRPPLASWGTLINDGYAFLSDTTWPVLTAAAALSIATLGFTLLGEALQEALDPRRRPRA